MKRRVPRYFNFYCFTQVWLKSITQQFTHITLSFESLVVDVITKYWRWYVCTILYRFSLGFLNHLIASCLCLVAFAFIHSLVVGMVLEGFELLTQWISQFWRFEVGLYWVIRHDSKWAFVYFVLILDSSFNGFGVVLCNSL